MKQHIDYIVHGFVQGVGFRYYVYRHASELNLSGFTKNNFDGTVSVTAEGEDSELQLLREYLMKGPTRSKVEKVEYFVSGYSGIFTGFEIR